MVIDRMAAGVFGSLRSHSPAASRTSCSVTRTFPCRRSSLARRSPISSLQRIPESNGEIDERLVPLQVCLGQVDGLLR